MLDLVLQELIGREEFSLLFYFTLFFHPFFDNKKLIVFLKDKITNVSFMETQYMYSISTLIALAAKLEFDLTEFGNTKAHLSIRSSIIMYAAVYSKFCNIYLLKRSRVIDSNGPTHFYIIKLLIEEYSSPVRNVQMVTERKEDLSRFLLCDELFIKYKILRTYEMCLDYFDLNAEVRVNVNTVMTFRRYLEELPRINAHLPQEFKELNQKRLAKG